MPDQLLIIIAVVLFLAVGFMVKNRKATSIEEFSARRNRLSWFVTAAGVSMTFVGGAALLNSASLGYSYKWYTLVDPVAFMTGIIISVLFVRNYRNDTGLTISQLLSGINKKLSLYIGIITSVIFLLVISAQFVAFSKLLAPYFPNVNPALLMIIPSWIILLYVLAGGFAAVTNTDVLQLFFIFIFLLIPVGYYLVTTQPSTSYVAGKTIFAPMPAELMIYFCIYGLFIPVSQDINIRAKSAKDVRHARIGFICGGIFYSLIIIACSYIGITLAEHGVKVDDTEHTFPTFFKNFYPTFGIFPILAGMAAIWSTLDTYLVNCITSVAQDILKKSNYFKKREDRKLIIIAGIIIFLIAISISLYYDQVLSLILFALLVYISVLIPIAIGKKIKMKDDIIFIVSLVTVIIILLFEVQKIKVSPKAIIYPVSAVFLMLAGRLYQNIAAKK
jgi:Na+/panthothenate symporter